MYDADNCGFKCLPNDPPSDLIVYGCYPGDHVHPHRNNGSTWEYLAFFALSPIIPVMRRVWMSPLPFKLIVYGCGWDGLYTQPEEDGGYDPNERQNILGWLYFVIPVLGLMCCCGYKCCCPCFRAQSLNSNHQPNTDQIEPQIEPTPGEGTVFVRCIYSQVFDAFLLKKPNMTLTITLVK